MAPLDSFEAAAFISLSEKAVAMNFFFPPLYRFYIFLNRSSSGACILSWRVCAHKNPIWYILLLLQYYTTRGSLFFFFNIVLRLVRRALESKKTCGERPRRWRGGGKTHIIMLLSRAAYHFYYYYYYHHYTQYAWRPVVNFFILHV